jgi:hypothetical protein
MVFPPSFKGAILGVVIGSTPKIVTVFLPCAQIQLPRCRIPTSMLNKKYIQSTHRHCRREKPPANAPNCPILCCANYKLSSLRVNQKVSYSGRFGGLKRGFGL